jgi:hypothetical protein
MELNVFPPVDEVEYSMCLKQGVNYFDLYTSKNKYANDFVVDIVDMDEEGNPYVDTSTWDSAQTGKKKPPSEKYRPDWDLPDP